MYEWNWRIISEYRMVFIEGALTTLWLTLFVVVVGTFLGIILAFFKQSRFFILRFLAKAYIEVFRALPILVVIIWIYYALPVIFDWRVSAFKAAGISLSLHLSAFVAETIRAALQSIPMAQLESGLALGISRLKTMLFIIIPQALRNMIPNLLGLYINELKNSSLASVIAVDELLHRGNILISGTFRPLEIYTAVAVTYLLIIIPFVILAHYFERRLIKGAKSSFLSKYDVSN